MARSTTDSTHGVSTKRWGSDEVESLLSDWRAERSEIPMDSLRVFLPLRRALQMAEERRAVILRRHAITPAMFDLLVALRRAGHPYVQTPSELTRVLVLSAGGVSQRLDRLEQSGLVERTVNRDDRRVVYVRLTTAGLKALDALIEEYMAHEERLLAGVPANDRRRLAALLLRLEDSIAAAGNP